MEKDGGVTLEDLRTTFKTNAWKEIHDDNSKICKLLTHSVFKHSEGVIRANALICFALYHCAGSPKDKAAVLYGIF